MFPTASCSNINVLAMNRQAYQLLEVFCDCPQAKELLNVAASVAPLFINIGAFPNPQTEVMGDSLDSISGMNINIPKESTGRSLTRVLRDLSIELFNAKNIKKTIEFPRLANLGNLNIDEYARSVERSEYEALISRSKLLSICKEDWGIEEDPVSQFSPTKKNYPVERYLLDTEASCHTDSIRKRWVDNYQKIYCKKHPEDSHSCKAKKRDFCDYAKVKNMDFAAKEKFVDERLCKVFSTLSKDEKKPLLTYMKGRCPKLKSEL